MGQIPENYLPPRELRPEYTVPDEFADTPMQLNLADYLLDRHVREGRGDNAAIKFMDRTMSYAELQCRVNQFGNALVAAGVAPQDRVGIWLPNSPQALIAIFATEKIGAIPVPTSLLWSVEEVSYVANNAEMKLLIVHASLMETLKPAKTHFSHGTKVVVIGGQPAQVKAAGNLVFEEMLEGGSSELDPFMLNADDIAVILYTSGTTGMPKGCVHFIRPAIIQTRMVNKYVWKMKPGDVLGGGAPLSFAAGFGTFTLMPFEGGAAVSLLPKFSPQEMLELIPKHRITILTGLPAGYRALMKFPSFEKYDFSSVRICTSGGDSLGAQTLKSWQKLTGQPIWEGLGGTEMLHLVTSNTMNTAPVPNSIGKALPGVITRVIDSDGRDCAPCEVGSMILKGPSGTLYWKPYDDGGRLLDLQRKGVVNGWNYLGDAVHAREDGNIFFVSREDDLIKSCGYRIGPAEVEEAIAQHPAVADVGVVGVPDPEKGQITKAVIVLKPGYEGSEAFSRDLKEFLKARISRYKLPRLIQYVKSLRRTPTGKLLRHKLRSW